MQNFSISRNEINLNLSPNTQEVLVTKINSALGLDLVLGLGLGLELGLANYKL